MRSVVLPTPPLPPVTAIAPSGRRRTRAPATGASIAGGTVGGTDGVVVSDEIYEHIYWGSSPYSSFAAACPALFDRTVTINGVSKAYAMTGWRVGYAILPPAIHKSRTSPATPWAGSPG